MAGLAAQLPPYTGGQWGAIVVAGQDFLLAGSAVARRLAWAQPYRGSPGEAALHGPAKRLSLRSHIGRAGGGLVMLPLLQKELMHGKGRIAALGRLARHAQQRGKYKKMQATHSSKGIPYHYALPASFKVLHFQ